MSLNYSQSELIAMGFTSVGENVIVSRDARFYAISGDLGNNARIDAFAILTGQVYIGDETHVSPFCFLGGTGGKIVMQRGSGLSTHVSLFTKSDDYKNQVEGARPKVSGDVIIGEYSILGSQCVVLPGVTIGKQCSLGAGCVIGENIPDIGCYVSAGIRTIRVK